MYLLDTCVISDFVKGDKPTLTKIKSQSPLTLHLSSISIMEIYYGLKRNPEKSRIIKSILEDFLESIQIVHFSDQDAMNAAEIRAELTKKGTPIGPYDLLLAGSALNNNLTIVTSNIKEFSRVPHLHCEDWRINL
jgi:tRNA(fMet)-specific endonuclease VapC